MQAVDKEVLGQILSWLREGIPCWLATVIETYGSSPRPVGSVLTCNAHGQMVGSLSGGCVEDDLLEKLTQGQLAASGPQFFQYGGSDAEAEKFNLPCGGHLNIVIEPLAVTPANLEHFQTLNTALDARQCVQRCVRLADNHIQVARVAGHAALQWDADTQVLTHTYGPRHQLFVIGAGMVSHYLAEIALMLDYDVTICDPRAEVLGDFRVSGVRKVADMPDDAVAKYASDDATAIVALTHDPRIDDMGLMEALTTQAFYIGAMGSSRTSAKRRERLAALDITPAQLDKLHAPIGLPIGSKTPPEIAVAIIAEITAVRSGRAQASADHLASASAG